MLTNAKLRNLEYEPLESKGAKNRGQLLGNRHTDRDGMYVFVSPTGAVSYRYDYRDPQPPHKRKCVVYGRYSSDADPAGRLAGIAKMLGTIHGSSEQEAHAITEAMLKVDAALAVFEGRAPDSLPERRRRATPLLTLNEAREAHRAFRWQLSRGVDPMAARKAKEQAAHTEHAMPKDFRSVAERWYAKNSVGKSPSWKQSARRHLDAAYPNIGARKVETITARDINAIIAPIENDGRAVTAAKTKQTYAAVFDHAIGKEFILQAGANPARVVKVECPATRHHAHLGISELPMFFAAVDAADCSEQLKIAVRLLYLTLTRKMELCAARWSELDLDNARWTIPAERMKQRALHIVPLSHQAVALFRRLKDLAGDSDYVFPRRGRRTEATKGQGLGKLYARCGYAGRVTSHGARSTGSSALNEMGFNPDAVERQLSHAESDDTRAAYMHSDFMTERRRMLQTLADAIDRLCAGGPLVDGNVIQLHAAA